MTTLALWPAEAATPTVELKAKPSLFQRLIKAREREAWRRIHMFLASHGDERLKDLGYTAKDIQAIRQGWLTMPSR